MLIKAGWLVQAKENIDLGANRGVALREIQADTKFAELKSNKRSINENERLDSEA